MVVVMKAGTVLLNLPQKQSDPEPPSDMQRGLKRKISTTSCDVCEAEEAKYRCPSCQRCSCSLPCVKQHKLRSGCSGVRDRTAFVPLSHFGDLNLLSDYRFLEETGRVVERPNRDTLLHSQPRHMSAAMLLKRKAKAAQVNLHILPKVFSRRRENRSRFIKSEQKLYWHLKLLFPQSNVEYTDRVPEDQVLEKILSAYIHPSESDPVKRQRLKTYLQASPDDVMVFMKAEQRRPGSPKFHPLDVKKSLRENLMFKTVVEFPDLHVVLREQQGAYLTPSTESKKDAHHSASLSEAPPKTSKSPKRDPTESELEDGEIRSEDEDEEEKTQVGCGAGDQRDVKDELNSAAEETNSHGEKDGGEPTKEQNVSTSKPSAPSAEDVGGMVGEPAQD